MTVDIDSNRIMCKLCGSWVKLGFRLNGNWKWYGSGGHLSRCLPSHPDYESNDPMWYVTFALCSCLPKLTNLFRSTSAVPSIKTLNTELPSPRAPAQIVDTSSQKSVSESEDVDDPDFDITLAEDDD